MGKRTRNHAAFARHGDKIVRNTLRLFDKLVQAADAPGATKEDIKTAVNLGIELLPYVKPKLAAIAQGILDSEGNVISPQRMRELISIAQQAVIEPPPLVNGDDRTLVQSSTEDTV